MPLPSTMTPLATITLTASTNSITFSNIPQTYTDLVLILNNGATVDLTGAYLRFNGDTGTNYSITSLYGNGSTATSSRSSTRSDLPVQYNSGIATTVISNCVANILNYSNATTYKTVISRANSTQSTSGTESIVGSWRNTATIVSVLIYAGANNFISGSTFTLYGIKAV